MLLLSLLITITSYSTERNREIKGQRIIRRINTWEYSVQCAMGCGGGGGGRGGPANQGLLLTLEVHKGKGKWFRLFSKNILNKRSQYYPCICTITKILVWFSRRSTLDLYISTNCGPRVLRTTDFNITDKEVPSVRERELSKSHKCLSKSV